jgi:hypothetical protein
MELSACKSRVTEMSFAIKWMWADWVVNTGNVLFMRPIQESK